MAVFLTDPELEARLVTQRAETGADKYDEAWDGVIFLPPLANIEHQSLGASFCGVFFIALGDDGPGRIFPGTNVSDREVDWIYNYRCPDVAVYRPGNPAKNCETHWFGGPDFAIEIASDNDRCREKGPILFESERSRTSDCRSKPLGT